MRRPLLFGLLAIAVATAYARLHISAAGNARATETALRQLLESPTPPAFVRSDADGTRLWTSTRGFYGHREFTPAWIDGGAPTPQLDALITAVRQSDREGMDPELYHIGVIEREKAAATSGLLKQTRFSPAAGAMMDAWLTYLYMRFASDLAVGVADLAHADPTWQIRAEPFDPLAHLERALNDNRVAESLAVLAPDDPEYRSLRTRLADLRTEAARGGWPAVPAGMKLKPGQRSTWVPLLAKRLAASGDYQDAVPPGDRPAVYAAALQGAVTRFQRRHGQTDDGIVGPSMVAALNVPIDQRIRQIELNMERWRWLPRDLGARHILINIPEMRLEVRDHGQVQLSMRVVVGKKETPTPIFNDQMTHVVFSPYWNVPPDIAEHETLPAILKDPAFLDRSNMEVRDSDGNPVDPASIDLSQSEKYRFRQRPGSGNSLGLVKFMFPNQFNVYLHDTPADSLFARASRSFSHGCVRIEAPEKLAEYVLIDQPEWTPERIAAAMHAGDERTVKLLKPLPVYLGYWTATVAPDGTLQFREDVYGIDSRQGAKLAVRMRKLQASTAALTRLLNATPAEAPPAGDRR